MRHAPPPSDPSVSLTDRLPLWPSCDDEAVRRIAGFPVSPVFLRGLTPEKIGAAPVTLVHDPHRAATMMASQAIWDTDPPWPHDYFVGVREDQWLAARKDLPRPFRDAFLERLDELNAVLLDMVRDHSGLAHLRSVAGDDVADLFANEVTTDLLRLLQIAGHGPIARNPFHNAVLRVYESGAVPCGWVEREPYVEDGRARAGDTVRRCLRAFAFAAH